MTHIEQIINKVHEVAMLAAPSDEVRQKWREYDIGLMPVEDDHGRLSMLAAALYDGIAWGNWPGVEETFMVERRRDVN